MSNRGRRICIIGLDGVNSLVAEVMGLKYPITADLVSTVPPYTPPAWTSMLTGVNPGMHGIYGFFSIKDNNVALNTSWNVRFPRLFEMCAMYGVKSVVVNVPLSYPFDALVLRDRYIVVTDWASPKQAIWPPKLNARFREYLGNPPHKEKQHSNIHEYISRIREYLSTRVNLYFELLERDDWSLYFIVFSETDWLLHKLPELLERRNVNLVQPIFNFIKKFIQEASELCELVLIVSDHGFEIKRWRININAILCNRGLLKYSYAFSLKTHTRKFISSKDRQKGTPLLLRVLSNAMITLPTKLLGRYLPLLVREFRNKVPIVSALDIGSSLAFMIEAPTWGVYVNRTDYVKFVKRILRKTPGIETVLSPGEVFAGPYVKYAPQVVVIPKRYVYLGDDPYGNVVECVYQSEHNMHGIFMATGDEIDNHTSIKTLKVYDIAPTVLYYLGLPLQKQCDGTPLKGLFTFSEQIMRRHDYLLKFKTLRTREELSKF